MNESNKEGESSKSIVKFGEFSSLEEFTKVIKENPCGNEK